jgi:hypothetical protein
LAYSLGVPPDQGHQFGVKLTPLGGGDFVMALPD